MDKLTFRFYVKLVWRGGCFGDGRVRHITPTEVFSTFVTVSDAISSWAKGSSASSACFDARPSLKL